MAQFAKHALTKSGPVVWPRRRSRRSTTQPKGGSFKSGNDATLLWIDDFAPALSLYKATMENLGFKVLTASSGEAGVKRASMEPVDLVVTDYEMSGMNGEAVAAVVKAMDPSIPVIIFSGSTMVSAHSCQHADAFCDKAAGRHLLLDAVHRLLHRKRNIALQPPPPLKASHHERRTVA